MCVFVSVRERERESCPHNNRLFYMLATYNPAM
jgi:hypothetical protein